MHFCAPEAVADTVAVIMQVLQPGSQWKYFARDGARSRDVVYKHAGNFGKSCSGTQRMGAKAVTWTALALLVCCCRA